MSKKVKIMLPILLVLIIAVVAVISIILNNGNSNQVKEKLGQIKTEELQNNLINELKNTSLNVNNSSMETYFGMQTDDSMDMSLSFYYNLVMENYKGNEENNDYVFAFVSSKNKKIGVVIPCFKIESDSNGNFKNIILPSHVGTGGNVFVPVKSIMWNTIEKVFREKYDIDVSKYSEYGKGKCMLLTNANIMASDSNRDYTIQVFKEITNNTDGYSWNNSKEAQVKNGNVFEDFEISQEIFGLNTIDTKDQTLRK